MEWLPLLKRERRPGLKRPEKMLIFFFSKIDWKIHECSSSGGVPKQPVPEQCCKDYEVRFCCKTGNFCHVNLKIHNQNTKIQYKLPLYFGYESGCGNPGIF